MEASSEVRNRMGAEAQVSYCMMRHKRHLLLSLRVYRAPPRAPCAWHDCIGSVLV